MGDTADVHVNEVARAIREAGGSAVVLDAASLEQTQYTIDADGMVLQVNGDLLQVPAHERGVRGLIRRVAPTDWRDSLVSGWQEGAIRGAWLALIVAIAQGFAIDWLTPLDRLVFCENKFVQYLACNRLGIPTPRTVIPSNRSGIPEALGEPVVVKALGPSWFSDREGAGRVVFSTQIPRDAAELESLAGAPFLVQERIEASLHLRVVTVENHCWVAELVAEGLPLDWRSSDEAHDSFTETDRHAEVERMAVKLATTLNLGYSSQDWAVTTTGEVYFLDLNPAGQWLFLPTSVTEAITQHLARWLTRVAQ